MTAEEFDKRRWSSMEPVVFLDVIHYVKCIDWGRRTLIIWDGVRDELEVQHKSVEIYKKKVSARTPTN